MGFPHPLQLPQPRLRDQVLEPCPVLCMRRPQNFPVVSFFQGNALLKHILLGPRGARINKVQMKPGFVMATLIGGT